MGKTLLRTYWTHTMSITGSAGNRSHHFFSEAYHAASSRQRCQVDQHPHPSLLREKHLTFLTSLVQATLEKHRSL